MGAGFSRLKQQSVSKRATAAAQWSSLKEHIKQWKSRSYWSHSARTRCTHARVHTCVSELVCGTVNPLAFFQCVPFLGPAAEALVENVGPSSSFMWLFYVFLLLYLFHSALSLPPHLHLFLSDTFELQYISCLFPFASHHQYQLIMFSKRARVDD